MRNNLKQKWEYVKAHALGLDDTFQFGCKRCGKCCKHREDILISAFDLYRIGKYLLRTPAEVIERYCEAYLGSSSHVFVVRTKPTPPDDTCPFQCGKKCSIHQAKPLICAMYPLGRAYSSDQEGPIYFLRPEINCGKMDQTTTVRQWIGEFAEHEAEIAGKRWSDTIGVISAACLKAWSNLNPGQREKLEDAQQELLYLSYDVEQPFLPQFEANIAKLMLLIIKEVGTDIVPTWLPIPDSMSLEDKAALLVRKSYWMYLFDWCKCRGFDPMDQDDKTEEFPDGCTYACFGEFQYTEYRDAYYMKQLLNQEDYELWDKIQKQERNKQHG